METEKSKKGRPKATDPVIERRIWLKESLSKRYNNKEIVALILGAQTISPAYEINSTRVDNTAKGYESTILPAYEKELSKEDRLAIARAALTGRVDKPVKPFPVAEVSQGYVDQCVAFCEKLEGLEPTVAQSVRDLVDLLPMLRDTRAFRQQVSMWQSQANA